MKTKQFATDDVMLVITGKLMPSGMNGIYQVLSWMAGEDVYTHQIPRVAREARPVILNMYPEFQDAIDEASQVSGETVDEWSAIWRKRYGEMIDVPNMTTDQHERIDPLSEAAEYVHPDKIIVVNSEPQD